MVCRWQQSLTPESPAVLVRHIGLGPGVVGEDQLRRIKSLP